MVKDIGQQAVSGQPYELLPTVSTSKSEKLQKKTIKKIQEQNQLRMEIKKYNPGVYLCRFCFEDIF